MARAAIVDRAGYAAERLNLDRHIDLTGKTYLMVERARAGLQTGLVWRHGGDRTPLVADESVYLMSVLSAMSDVKDAASYPFYSGMRNVPRRPSTGCTSPERERLPELQGGRPRHENKRNL